MPEAWWCQGLRQLDKYVGLRPFGFGGMGCVHVPCWYLELELGFVLQFAVGVGLDLGLVGGQDIVQVYIKQREAISFTSNFHSKFALYVAM